MVFILAVSFLQTRLRKRGVERKRQSERERGERRERDRLIARERGVEKETKRESEKWNGPAARAMVSKVVSVLCLFLLTENERERER